MFLQRKLSDLKSKPLILEKDRVSGLFAWYVILLGILAYEIYAIKTKKIETMTRAFWRITEKQLHGSIFTGVWLGLTFHLLIEKSLRQLIVKKG